MKEGIFRLKEAYVMYWRFRNREVLTVRSRQEGCARVDKRKFPHSPFLHIASRVIGESVGNLLALVAGEYNDLLEESWY